jgi:uncharacterized protein YozE (UPF0346 family)
MQPNFLIIGDIKAGSTSLYQYLRQHPQIFMPSSIKELRYFSFDAQNPYHREARSSRVRTQEDYLSYFEDAGDAVAVGEASPNYLRSPLASGKIKEMLPNAKLIVSLRSPVDRLYSLYLMSQRHKSRSMTFAERAFAEDANWIKGNACWPELLRYFKTFSQDQLKVVLFDDLTKNANSVVADLCNYLHVDGDFRPNVKVFNRGGVPRHRKTYSALVHTKNAMKAAGIAPAPLRRAWASIRDRAMVKPPLDELTRSKVIEVCRDDIYRTEELIGRDLSHWLS